MVGRGRDALRSDFLCKAIDVAIRSVRHVINVPDTVGYSASGRIWRPDTAV